MGVVVDVVDALVVDVSSPPLWQITPIDKLARLTVIWIWQIRIKKQIGRRWHCLHTYSKVLEAGVALEVPVECPKLLSIFGSFGHESDAVPWVVLLHVGAADVSSWDYCILSVKLEKPAVQIWPTKYDQIQTWTKEQQLCKYYPPNMTKYKYEVKISAVQIWPNTNMN